MIAERAVALQRRGLADWVRVLGSSSAGAEVLELDGVVAAVVPACPRRSLANSVAYEEAAALEPALDELADAYERAGVAAWTVWTPESDRDAIEVLEAAGHAHDGAPRAMSMELDGFEPPAIDGLDWDRDAAGAEIGRLNDLAYGLPADAGMAPALADPPAHLNRYRALLDGEAACVLGTIDHDRDLGVYFVATHPDHRGKGLASRLVTVALAEGRERGMRTSSLQSSPMGRPIYLRLGYGDDFAVNLYERRR